MKKVTAQDFASNFGDAYAMGQLHAGVERDLAKKLGDTYGAGVLHGIFFERKSLEEELEAGRLSARREIANILGGAMGLPRLGPDADNNAIVARLMDIMTKLEDALKYLSDKGI